MTLAPVTQPPAAAAAERIEPRAESVNLLLAKAYERASTLELTEDEMKRITADFDDSDFLRGAGGDANKIYLEHVALRKRLNDVIGIGKWVCVPRRSWSEETPVPAKPGKPASVAVKIYVESVLLVRGCFVGEAIGEGTYYKSNAGGSYGDGYESAKTSAFRRCTKDFGMGLQAYSKDWCNRWLEKYPGFERPVRK
jgi:hypothetical protein